MKKRIVALLLAVSVLAVLALSGALLAHEADHECGRTDCPICAALVQCGRLSRLLSIGLLLAGILRTPGTLCLCRHTARVLSFRAYSSPVALKVLLLD